jgi:hypothetical protein
MRAAAPDPGRPHRPLAAVAGAVAALALAACGGDRPAPPATHPDAARPFANARLWSAPQARDAPLDPRSRALVATLVASVRAQVARGTGPAMSAASRAPVYTVGAAVPRVPVALDSGPWAAALRRELARGVPIPADARPSRGSDGALVIWQPSSDTMWEMSLAQRALHAPLWLGEASVDPGGRLAAGVHRYGVTALNARGETSAAHPWLVARVAAPGGRVNLRWAPVEDATGYAIYRTSSEGTARLVARVPAGVTSFVDGGTGRTAADAPPAVGTATTPGRWRASNAGVLHRVSSSPGHYRDLRRPDGSVLERFNWGPSATSLPLAAGMVTMADLRRRRIDHALAIGLPNLTPADSVIAADRWAFPAQRADGKSSLPDAIPEGARLRLDPDLDLGALRLPPFVRMLADAAQRYGMIVQDGAPATVIYGEDPTPYVRAGEANPYDALARDPDALARFPWDRLEVLAMTICTDPRRPCEPPAGGAAPERKDDFRP